MTTETDICNLALSRIGHNRQIADMGEATTEGDIVRLHYPFCRDSVLRDHPWNFAIRRAELARLSETPAFEFTYKYPLPTEPWCLKVIRTRAESEGCSSADYRIEGRAILSNETTLAIEYIARITDTGQFDAMFVDCLASRIAAEVAMPLTNDAKVAEYAMRIYGQKLSEARTVDAQEGTPRQIVQAYSWLEARF